MRNVQYFDSCYIPLEITFILSMHVKKGVYESQKLGNNELKNKAFHILNQIKEEMGTYFDAHYKDASYLFDDIKENFICSCATSYIMSVADIHKGDKELFKNLRTALKNDPLLLLRIVADSDLDETAPLSQNEMDMLTHINDFNISEEKKWKILQAHLHSEETIALIEDVIHNMKPIYLKYEKQMQPFFMLYEEARLATYPEQDLFHHTLTILDFTFEDGDKPIFIVPSVACIFTMALTAIRIHQPRWFIVWGVGLLVGLEEDKKSIGMDEICSHLKLLGDKSKYEILRILSKEKSYGAQLAKQMDLSTPTISYHLQALLNAGFVSIDKENNRIYYRLNEAYIHKFFDEVKKGIIIK